jgi:hypothetical protein
MKWLGYFLIVTMLFSICTVVMPITYSKETEENDCCSEEETNEEETNEEETKEEPLALGAVYGFVYMRYYIFCSGIAWAEVHFIAEDGTEYNAYSNGGGVYYLKLPRGTYTVYADYAWYKSEEVEVIIDVGSTPINLYVEIPYSRSGRPHPNP